MNKSVEAKDKDTIVWEDTEGYLKLAKLEFPTMIPRSKHYTLMYH